MNFQRTIEDDQPELGYGRRWRWGPDLSWNNGDFLQLGWALFLIRMKGQRTPPTPVEGWWLGIALKPVDWKIGGYHNWYDGQLCSWWFGPFFFERNGRHCEKCEKGLAE